MNLKRRLLVLVYAVLLVAMCYSGLQLFSEEKVQAEAGTCCSTSTDCGGEKLCYTAAGQGLENCCVPQSQGCTGTGYCMLPHSD
jgi:hypothetical protein